MGLGLLVGRELDPSIRTPIIMGVKRDTRILLATKFHTFNSNSRNRRSETLLFLWRIAVDDGSSIQTPAVAGVK